MNLKERKKMIETNVEESVKRAVQGDVKVSANYNLAEGVVEVSMSQTHRMEGSDNVANIVFYQINYQEERDEIGVYAFSRVFQYDSLSVAAVMNQPVVIDEGFLSDMKLIIKHGFNLKEAAEAAEAEQVEEVVEEVA